MSEMTYRDAIREALRAQYAGHMSWSVALHHSNLQALAEQRPAVYRMLDATGRVVYVGKAKRLRARLLSYFRDDAVDDRPARIPPEPVVAAG